MQTYCSNCGRLKSIDVNKKATCKFCEQPISINPGQKKTSEIIYKNLKIKGNK